MKWKSICWLLVLLSVHSVMATEALYQNNAILEYSIPGNPPPNIDAVAFDNQNIFSVSQFTYTPQTFYYEPWNTLYYTNSGTMIVNSPNTTNGIIYYTFGTGSFGLGFQFDNQTDGVNPHKMAGTFYNPGTIRCASVLDGNNLFYIYNLFGSSQLYSLSSYGKCLVSATNVISPGTIDVSVGGLIQLDGKNVDLSSGVLTNEALLDYTGFFNSVSLSSTGAVGTDTNGDWNPGVDLSPTYADSSFVPIPPYELFLTNSSAYFDVQGAGTSNQIIRAVFVQNNSINAPYRVYIDSPNAASLGFEAGAAHVEWDGYYVDPATGQNITNYLYLTDDYIFGASTNVAVIGGVPDNFSFISSSTRLLFNPVSSGFLNVFNDAYITNPYAFFNAQLIASSISTNVSAVNPHGTVTNLPGRVEINADNSLTLDHTIIDGPSYLSLNAPHQFNGSAGAQITSPYSDINLGVTNGFMTVSNLLSATIPTWSGTIQAWSTRWIEVDSSGVTNDYRVLLVGSDLRPTSIPWVKDLTLHGTNTLVLSDALNIYNSVNIDAQRLNITTNGPGNGATSIEGELNWYSAATFGSPQMPNLLWLTNNGAIHVRNLGQFMGSSNYDNVTPGQPAVAASGVLVESNTNNNVAASDQVSIGTYSYDFVNSINNTTANQVKIGASFDASLNNLIAAINRTAGAGTVYSTNTSANAFASAGALSNHSFTVTAKIPGSLWNSLPISTTSANLTWGGSSLSGGIDSIAGTTNSLSVSVPYHQFINNGLLTDQGSIIWAENFESSGAISNGIGSFNLTSLTTTLTNTAIIAGNDISIAANSLVTSNALLQAGRSLVLAVTNSITDSALTNGNIWTVQSTNGTGGNGLILSIKPTSGDLLGTTITNYCPGPNRQTINIWAGDDSGISLSGFTNNAAVGRLVLDAVGLNSKFIFQGTGVSNAIYIDDLEFTDFMTNGINHGFDFSDNLSIANNMMVYFAQATAGGTSIAAKIDAASRAGANGGRLRWIPAYAGHYSSAQIVYPDGTTNSLNAALVGSSTIDSDGDGLPNGSDTTPLFVPSQVGLQIVLTTNATPSALIRWNSIPGATNYVYFATNMNLQAWSVLTNYVSPSVVPPVGGWPITNNVMDSFGQGQERFYKVKVVPDSSLQYGN